MIIGRDCRAPQQAGIMWKRVRRRGRGKGEEDSRSSSSIGGDRRVGEDRRTAGSTAKGERAIEEFWRSESGKAGA
jgi:hypothetical protein